MRFILFALVAVFLTSCDNKNTITVSGTFAGAADGSKIYFQKVNEQNQPYNVDTITVNNGKFSLEVEKQPHTEVAALYFVNLGSTLIFFQENKDITATMDFNDIYKSTFVGGTENGLFNEYKKTIYDFYEKRVAIEEKISVAQQGMNNEDFVRLRTESAQNLNEEKSYKKQFVEKNLNTTVAMLALNELISKKEITLQEAESLLQKRKSGLPDNLYSRLISTNLDNLRTAEVGNMAPEFSGPTPDGKTLALTDVLKNNKLTLIDFWASWCKPCRIENPNVVRVYNQYKDQGFTVLSVSLDRADHKDRWLQAIEDDQMDWYHISNLQHWNEPIARQYGVRSIPATFLVDSEGKIVAQNLRGNALGQRVGEFLANQVN